MENIFIAEAVGTGLLVLLGNGVVASALLTSSKGKDVGSSWMMITTGWGFAVAIGVYAAGVFSGAHINPAVTIGFAAGGLTPWADVPAYLLGQIVGAFLAAGIVWASYMEHYKVTDDSTIKLATFSTIPNIRSTVPNFITELVGTFVLLVGILAIVNTSEAATQGLGAGLNPFLIGVLVWAIGLSLGGPTGYAINPARDLGPRIMHALLPIPGKRDSDWSYSWIPVLAPIVGGVLGVLFWQAIT